VCVCVCVCACVVFACVSGVHMEGSALLVNVPNSPVCLCVCVCVCACVRVCVCVCVCVYVRESMVFACVSCVRMEGSARLVNVLRSRVCVCVVCACVYVVC